MQSPLLLVYLIHHSNKNLSIMKTLENLIIAKENVKKAWGETLTENGFENLGRMFDRHKKHYQVFKKNDLLYTANPKTLEDGSQVFIFTDVTDKNLRF